MIEGDQGLSARCEQLMRGRAWSVEVCCMMVTSENAAQLAGACPTLTPDFLSLDIDGIDFFVLKALVNAGLRPKVISVEYNSVFGPTRCVSVPDSPPVSRWKVHSSGLYYGASVGAWRRLLEPIGYHFVTVDSSGVNAFFALRTSFDEGFLAALRGLEFRDNQTDRNAATRPIRTSSGFTVPPRSWESQLPLISGLPLVDV
jgi:hypothetical protein